MASTQTYQTIHDTIEDSLLKARRIFISDAVDSDSANEIIRKLWYLELQEPGKPILFVINSPGGSVDAGFAIWDQVKLISSPVHTLVTGLAASMGSVLSLCADKGNRYATRYSRFLVHPPLLGGMMRGQATDLEIQAKEIIKTRETLVDIYTEATGKEREEINKLLDRDLWMSANEALAFGLIDKLVNSFDEMPLK